MLKSPFVLYALLFVNIINTFSQTNYYVSKSGNDNNNGLSINSAWNTVQKASKTLQAGDTVFITTGTYNEIVIPTKSGTKYNRITYTAYQNDKVILDGTNFSDTYLQFSDRGIFDLKNKHYINIEGLTIKNSNAGGIMCRYGSSNINIKNNTILNCDATGIGVGYSRENNPLATNIIVANNIVDNCSLKHRESISLRSVIDFEIYGNIVTNTPKEAIDTKSGCANGKIYKNKVVNAHLGIYIDGGFKDPLYNSLHNIHVYQNTIKNCNTSFAVASEEGCLAEDVWFYNNIAYDIESRNGNGFVIANYEKSGPIKDIYIINNTVYNKGHRGFYINNITAENIIVKNNIFSNNTISQIDIKSSIVTSTVLKNNLIDGETVDSGESAVFGNPDFVSIANEDFRLNKNSIAINKGTAIDAPTTDFDGIPRPFGSAHDIGAFEYSSTLPIENPDIKNYTFYPNPTENIFFIDGKDITKVEIYTTQGKFLSTIKNDLQLKTLPVELKSNAKGMYLLKIFNSQKSIVKKVILK